MFFLFILFVCLTILSITFALILTSRVKTKGGLDCFATFLGYLSLFGFISTIILMVASEFVTIY